MIACIILVLYTCPDVGFNKPKQMASVLSSCFNKIVVEIVKKKIILHVEKIRKIHATSSVNDTHSGQQTVEVFVSNDRGAVAARCHYFRKSDTPQKFGMFYSWRRKNL